MRDTFDNLGQLFAYYQYMKSVVRGAKTLIPKPDEEQVNFNPTVVKAAREEKLCFIGDMENYCKYYYEVQRSRRPRVPLDCIEYIFRGAFSCEGIYKLTLGDMANHFRERIKRGDNVPAGLKHKGKIHRIVQDMVYKSRDYYIYRGMLLEPYHSEDECVTLRGASICVEEYTKMGDDLTNNT